MTIGRTLMAAMGWFRRIPAIDQNSSERARDEVMTVNLMTEENLVCGAQQAAGVPK